jgi:hypothetical protein
MNRTLYTKPILVDWPTLDAELRAVVPTFRGVNDVNGAVAVYCDVAPDTDAVTAVVSAHAGVSEPAPDPLHQLAQAIVDAETLDDVKQTAQAILSDGE